MLLSQQDCFIDTYAISLDEFRVAKRVIIGLDLTVRVHHEIFYLRIGASHSLEEYLIQNRMATLSIDLMRRWCVAKEVAIPQRATLKVLATVLMHHYGAAQDC